MRIRNAAGEVFEGPDGTPLPAGWTEVKGPLTPAPDLSKFPKGPGGFPIVPPEMRGQVRDVPGVGQVALKNIKERYPQIAAQVAGTLMGNPYLGALAGGGAMAGGKMLQGSSPLAAAKAGGMTAGIGAAIPGLVQGGAATLGSAPLRRMFANDTMQKVGAYLKEKIPPFSGFKSDEKGVIQMLVSPRGYNALHNWYDNYFKDLVKRGTDKNIEILADDAKALGIPVVDNIAAKGANVLSNPSREGYVLVNGSRAAEKTSGQWRKNPGEFGRVNQALDQAGLGDPAMREGYKIAMGGRKFLGDQNAFKGERYNPELAQQGLVKPRSADELSRRGMERFYDIIRGPGKHPVTESGINPWVKRATGGAVGEIGAEMLGMPRGLGFPAGLLAAEALVPQYRNVPLPAGLKAAGPLAPQAAAQVGQKVSSSD